MHISKGKAGAEARGRGKASKVLCQAALSVRLAHSIKGSDPRPPAFGIINFRFKCAEVNGTTAH